MSRSGGSRVTAGPLERMRSGSCGGWRTAGSRRAGSLAGWVSLVVWPLA